MIRALFVVLLSATSTQASELDTLVRWMTGSFSSAAQAESDERYYDIRLEMVPVWTERTEARWLYVEQATASAPDRPYRQRVYRVTSPSPGTFVSEVFELPEPSQFVGAFRSPDAFDALAPDELLIREGCAVVLQRVKSSFVGVTDGDACGSTLRGATFATSLVTVNAHGIDSWDRGFDSDGKQVWGAEAGAYEFRRNE